MTAYGAPHVSQDSSVSAEDALRTLALIRNDGPWFYKNVLGCHPWAKQREIDAALYNHREVIVPSCNSSGKTYIAARAVLRWLVGHPRCAVVTTAPTGRQVKQLLWREIRKAHGSARVPIGGVLNQTDMTLSPEQVAFGFASRDYDENRIAGIHDDAVLIVVDEGDGVSQAVLSGIEGLMAGGKAALLMIGNPLNGGSAFARMFRDANTHKIRISAFDTPNFTSFGLKQEHIESGAWEQMAPAEIGSLPLPMLISPHWAARMGKRWGFASAFYQARVLARFPTQSADALFMSHWISKAREAQLTPAPGTKKILSLDVARKGIDENVLGLRQGPEFRLLWRTAQELRTTYVKDRVKLAFYENKMSKGTDEIRIDVIGIGSGIVDELIRDGYPAIGVNFGQSATNPERFVNARAESYWNLREALENGMVDFPDDEDGQYGDDLEAELLEQRWKPGNGGRIQLVGKDDLNIVSPNYADCAAIAWSSVEEAPFAFA